MRPKLLPRSMLVKTGPVDHADWNYRPLLGWLQRRRFSLICKMMGDRKWKSALEIGYGCGIFLPELAARAETISGIDVHDRNAEVAETLGGLGIETTLEKAGATKLPFEDSSFDCVIAISSLEFIDDLDGAFTEISRVMTPDGRFIVVTPGSSPILDFGLKLLTGESAKDDFADRRDNVIPTLNRHFSIDRETAFPPIGIRLYRAFAFAKPNK